MAVSHFDRLFRLIFSTSEAKADLARNVLPSRYLEKISLESLQSEDESFIDEELKEHFTDILMFFELKEEKNSDSRPRRCPRSSRWSSITALKTGTLPSRQVSLSNRQQAGRQAISPASSPSSTTSTLSRPTGCAALYRRSSAWYS